jgi:polysaccharide biosynthesis/export protein
MARPGEASFARSFATNQTRMTVMPFRTGKSGRDQRAAAPPCVRRGHAAVLMILALVAAGPSAAATGQSSGASPAAETQAGSNYVVGPQDVLTITSYDQPDLTGKFTVEADGTFAYPLIGRVKAGDLTLRQIEAGLKSQLQAGGFFTRPQITVSVEQYRSQKVFVVGEVRTPGTYVLSGDMTLVEVLARAGSTMPTSSGEAVIVHVDRPGGASGPILPNEVDPDRVVRVNLRELETGELSHNTPLRDGDTIFVPRAESVYVSGQVKNPGAYPLQQRNTTVLQALSLAGGMTEHGSGNRIVLIRIEAGAKKELRVKMNDLVKPGDTIVVPERYFE